MTETSDAPGHRVVIIGGGFGGLNAAKSLNRVRVDVTLVDRRNFHLFQPLLYQIATGGLSPGDISAPLRAVLKRQQNISVQAAEVGDIDPQKRQVFLDKGGLTYDTLIVAAGSSHHYFGQDQWATRAPGLKSLEDALEIRRRIFLAFEAAEREEDALERQTWMRFVVVGGGPTGVELSGALAELAQGTLKDDFRRIDPRQAEVILIEGSERVLASYPPELAANAVKSLERLGVLVRTETNVKQIEGNTVTVQKGDSVEAIKARTVLWAAGMKGSVLGQVLARKTGAQLDRSGRITVGPDLTIPGYPAIFVIGDLAHCVGPGDKPLPGVAPVAMQQGRYVALVIKDRLKGKQTPAFHYRDKGSLAVIGRNAAVADLGFVRFSGRLAWLAWLFVHIGYLIGYSNKLLVLFQWSLDYFTRKHGARLITGTEILPSGNMPQGTLTERETP